MSANEGRIILEAYCQHFGLHLFTVLVSALYGVWFYLPYYYFRLDPAAERLSAVQIVTEEATKVEESIRLGEGDSVSGRRKSNHSSSRSKRRGSSSSSFLGKPEFSIFDGTKNAVDPDSPWAQYLYDDGEDDSYQENCEYDDSDYRAGSGAGGDDDE